MPTSRDELKTRLQETPFLLVNVENRDVDLVSKDQMLAALGKTQYFIMDLGGGLPRFEKLYDDSEFSLKKIADIAGVSYVSAHAWLRQNVIAPSIRKATGPGRGREPQFSFVDAYAAGVIGTMRRNGLNQEMMRLIGPLLNGDTKQAVAKVRTPRRP